MGKGPYALYRHVRSFVKLGLCLLCFAVYFVALLLAGLALFFLEPAAKRRLVSRFTRLFDRCLVRIINIRVKVTAPETGGASKSSGAFLVSNHLGYVDGLVLGSVFPVVYVSKLELKSWPLIGLMTDFSGTLYIDRNRKNHIASSIALMAQTLKGGANILFFPEGTSSGGETLLPFKSAFFEAPLSAGAPVVPVSISYRTVNGEPLSASNKDSVYWYGEMTFADHFFRLLLCDSVEAQVRIHPPLYFKETEDRSLLRKRASELSYETIRRDLWPDRS